MPALLLIPIQAYVSLAVDAKYYYTGYAVQLIFWLPCQTGVAKRLSSHGFGPGTFFSDYKVTMQHPGEDIT